MQPTPRAGFSPESLELRAAFDELIKIKDAPWFHIHCYSEASPAHEWGKYMSRADTLTTFTETGVMHSDLRQMGLDYCESEGKETNYTQTVFHDYMKPEWVNLRPVPTPNSDIRITVGRPYKAVSERLADCVWGNTEMEDLFREQINQSNSVSDFALVIETALDIAEDKTTWDGAMSLMTICNLN